MPLLFLRLPLMQPIDFTNLNLFGPIGPFQKPEGPFDLRHLIDNFCHLFGPYLSLGLSVIRYPLWIIREE
jgi:hypothetical protein